MIDFLLTPIGIWIALMSIVGILFLVGAILSIMNSLLGEAIAMYSATAAGILGVLGLLPALYFSSSPLFEMAALFYGILMLLVALLAAVMSSGESSRGY